VLILEKFSGFEWDEGNSRKNLEKHNVSDSECEQVFFNQPLLIFFDEEHSEIEQRYYVLGRMDKGRRLFVVFTPRKDKIRVISARDMTKKERGFYPV
jgi:uncharacterized DUF497 family protein